MKKLLESLAHFFSGFPDALRRRRWIVLGAFLAVTVLCFMGMQRLKFDMTIEGWFADDDPTLVALDGYHAQFGSEDHYFIVYKPKDGDVFSAKSLELLRRIQNDFLNYRASLPDTAKSPLDHIVKVNTLLNAPILEVHDDVLVSRHLIDDSVPTSAAALKDLTRTAEAQRSFPLQYFSKDHQYGGILLETNFGAIPLDAPEGKADAPSDKAMGSFSMQTAAPRKQERVRFKKTDLGDYLALMQAINKILDKPEYAGHFEYHPVGNGPTTEYSLNLVKEMGMLNGLTLLIMILLLWFVHRSLSAVVWSLAIIFLAVIWTLGISGWIGMKASPFVMLTIMLILTVGVCDTVHLIAGYNFQRRLGADKWSAIKTVYHESAAACVLTAFTTMVGLQASNFTSIVPMEVFALMTGLGVGVTLVITLFLLPLMLDLWAPNPLARHAKARVAGTGKVSAGFIPDISAALDGFLAKVFPFVDQHKARIVGLSGLAFVVCVAGMTRLRVNSDQIKQFPESAPIRKSYEIVDQKMMGGHFVEIFWNLGKESAFQDPKVLKVMDELQRTLERKYDLIIRTSSLADVVKDSYMKLNGGSPDKYVIPDDANTLSQTLFLFNNANGDARRRLVSDDYSKSHISIQMHNAGSYELTRKFDKMRVDIDAALAQIRKDYPDAKVTITGLFTLMMEGAQYVTENGLLSFIVVAALVGIILLFLFNSFKAGLIALAPNLIPFVMTFGTMGLLKVSLDFYTLMLASEVIGISVDDSVHYIAHYRERFMETGDIRTALKATINEAGRSVTFTSMVLSLGFGVMAFASNPSTAHFGQFGFLAIVVGFMQDLLLLPAMILIFKLKFKREGTAHAAAVTTSVGELAH